MIKGLRWLKVDERRRTYGCNVTLRVDVVRSSITCSTGIALRTILVAAGGGVNV